LHRILLIAKRDYVQTVLTKAYLVGLVLLPLMFGGGFLVLAITNRASAREQRIAVVDHTGLSAAAVIQSCEEGSHRAVLDAPGALRVIPHYIFEEVKPDADEPAQLLSLSNRIRSGELFLVLDISRDALQPSPGDKKDDKKDDKNNELVHYYTNSSGVNQLGLWLPAAVNDGLSRVRLSQLGVDPARLPDAMREVDVVSMNLVTTDPATGKIVQGEKRNPVEMGMPFFLVFLLIMVVLIGSAPHIGAVAEDKMQRVFEMLLVSASSFELMMGKVLAALGASLTSSTLYILGGLMVLSGMAMFGLAPLDLLPWFFVYLIADVIILSALGVALGSACGSAQDAQQLAFLLFLPVVIPMLTLSPVMAQPNGAFATAMSFIPPFTPVLMLLRQAMPGGVPWWQPFLGLVGVAVFAYFAIWAAARIFRIGILSQGKAPKPGELAQWVLRG
jgi:ABC-2 type transport system permease protein